MNEIQGLSILQKDVRDEFRAEQRNEIQSIKTQLARDNINVNIKDIEAAILLPEDIKPPEPPKPEDLKPGEEAPKKKYPTPGEMLMVNPFPAKKKKKKKKKNKK